MRWIVNCILFLFLSFDIALASRSDPILGIVGGSNVQITQAPWEAYLEIVHVSESGYSRRKSSCGGAIINEKWILTAAHCTCKPDVTSINVRVGSTYQKNGGKVIQVETVIVHGEHDAFTFDYDFSLLKLHEPIHINNFTTKAINLPNPSDKIHTNSSCIVAGWGRTVEFDRGSHPNNLQGVGVSIVSHWFCQNKYSHFRGGLVIITDRMICAASETGDKDVCRGDSGGPLVCKTNDGAWKQFGIVSFGARCASPRFPNVYASVQSVRSWIRKYTGS